MTLHFLFLFPMSDNCFRSSFPVHKLPADTSVCPSHLFPVDIQEHHRSLKTFSMLPCNHLLLKVFPSSCPLLFPINLNHRQIKGNRIRKERGKRKSKHIRVDLRTFPFFFFLIPLSLDLVCIQPVVT